MNRKLEDVTEAEAVEELAKMAVSAERNADQLSYKLAKEREEYKREPAPDTLAIIRRTEKQYTAAQNRLLVLRFCLSKIRG